MKIWKKKMSRSFSLKKEEVDLDCIWKSKTTVFIAVVKYVVNGHLGSEFHFTPNTIKRPEYPTAKSTILNAVGGHIYELAALWPGVVFQMAGSEPG